MATLEGYNRVKPVEVPKSFSESKDMMLNTKKKINRPNVICSKDCSCKEFLQEMIKTHGEHRLMIWIKCRLREIEHDRNRKQKDGS